MSKLVQQWFFLARKDLNHAQFNWKHQVKNDCKELVAFLCQQCAEKSIKGLLQFHEFKFEKTHDLSKLSAELVKLYPELDSLLNEVVKLSQYAVIIRYPDAVDVDLKIEAIDKALQTSQSIYE